MNKNTLYRLYSAAFIGICLVPAVCMPFVKADSSKEKRRLAEMPKIKTEEGALNTEFFSQFDDWFSEHFAFRQQMVTADGRLMASALGTSPNKDVIVGSDGWLYYGETANDYLRIYTLSPEGIRNIVRNLDLIDRYCSENGKEFVFTCCPNKNTLYPEHMPKNYSPSHRMSNYEMLTMALSNRDYCLDMKSALLSADASIPLYHKTDTHWNNMGAYVGHNALMMKIGRESCPLGDSWTVRNDRLGDLAAMIYPAEDAKDAQVYNSYEFTYQYQGHFRALDDITIETKCERGQGSLTMFRDSYGEAILPYMAECFDTAVFSRAVPYNINGAGGDTVIIEIVERNLGNLQKYAPLMPAPETDTAGTAVEADIRTEETSTFTHVYGTVPESGKRVLITSEGRTYEAFNCFEDKLLGREGETDDCGFSAYIPLTDNINDITISVTD